MRLVGLAYSENHGDDSPPCLFFINTNLVKYVNSSSVIRSMMFSVPTLETVAKWWVKSRRKEDVVRFVDRISLTLPIFRSDKIIARQLVRSFLSARLAITVSSLPIDFTFLSSRHLNDNNLFISTWKKKDYVTTFFNQIKLIILFIMLFMLEVKRMARILFDLTTINIERLSSKKMVMVKWWSLPWENLYSLCTDYKENTIFPV